MTFKEMFGGDYPAVLHYSGGDDRLIYAVCYATNNEEQALNKFISQSLIDGDHKPLLIDEVKTGYVKWQFGGEEWDNRLMWVLHEGKPNKPYGFKMVYYIVLENEVY